MIQHRYSKADNPYVPDHDTQKPNNYITYLNCANLYGTAMTQPLPFADLRWLERNKIHALDLHALRYDDETGYILEVDLDYPQHLHNLHSDYPLASEMRSITDDMLSPYCMRMKLLKGFNCITGKKLITSLDNKKNNFNYRTLQCYLELGMEMKAVHRVLPFLSTRVA